MQAGQLNEIIEIWKHCFTTNEYGEQADDWQFAKETKAKVSHDSGSKTIENNEVFYSYAKTFTIRYYHNVAEVDRIKYQDKFYRIMSIEKIRQYNQIDLTCELINE